MDGKRTLDLSRTLFPSARSSFAARSVGNDPNHEVRNEASHAVVRNDVYISQANSPACPPSAGSFLSPASSSQLFGDVHESYLTSDLQQDIQEDEFFQLSGIPLSDEIAPPLHEQRHFVAPAEHDSSGPVIASSIPDDCGRAQQPAGIDPELEFPDLGFDFEDEQLVDVSQLAGQVDLGADPFGDASKNDPMQKVEVASEVGADVYDPSYVKLDNAFKDLYESNYKRDFVDLLAVTLDDNMGRASYDWDTATSAAMDTDGVVAEETLISSGLIANLRPLPVGVLQRAVVESGIDLQPTSSSETPATTINDKRAALWDRTMECLFENSVASTAPMSVDSSSSSLYDGSSLSPASSAYTASPAASQSPARAPRQRAPKAPKVKGTQGRKPSIKNPDERKERKREQNREAAARYRQNKKLQQAEHDEKLKVLALNNKKLRKELKETLAKFEGARLMAQSWRSAIL